MTVLEPADALDPAPLRARSVWHRLARDPAFVTGAAIAVVMTLLALAAPLLAAWEGQDPTTFHDDLLDSARGGVPIGPLGGIDGTHWLGVEPGTGRDLFVRVLYGARVSLGVGVAATLVEVLIGVTVGLAAGLGGRIADAVLGRFADLAIAFPSLVLAVALLAIVPDSWPRPLLLTLVIGFLGWGGTARITRAETVSLRTRDYVAAARLAGAGRARIARREILPGLAAPVLAYAALLVPQNMIAEAALSFLGVGVRPPTASWGQMLSSATTWFRSDPMYVIVPGGLLFLTLLAFTLAATSLRRALDPRSAR
ncbi:ABC transporter permease [Cryptosporangium arvum]|uniref:ABC-type dipeptide/oligopeptide/nickel transport system, permease component n=1 Tax=Cryptosporangium arvum DSM 44712 TaxID=927661 RepID=A0A010YPU0_9ACTN|nr:ABC transporter permease [Cryptosporangium arvum]EXG82200.1 ABC-type dipeptide/oligopeptide/nickel transport system, permease component [Cryptosporangium arvum DSM 44712]